MKINLFKRHILAVEFVENGIKLAIFEQAEKEKRIVALEFFSGSAEELKNKLSEFLKKKNLNYSKVIASLNRYIISSRYISLPSSDYQEIEGMIPFQIRRLFPYSAEDVTFSFDILDTDDKGFSRVMLFVAQKERVENFINILEDLNLKPEVLAVSSCGIVNWYQGQNVSLQGQAAAIVDVNKTSLEFCVLYTNRLAFSRAVLLSDSSNIAEEIKKCFAAYEKELHIAKISNLILAGDMGILKTVSEELSGSLAVTTQVLDPWQGLKINKGKDAPAEYANLGWTAVIGLCIQAKPCAINLLPSRTKEEIQQKKRVNSRSKTLLISAILVVLISLNIMRYINYHSKILQKIDEKLSVLNPEIEKLSDMQRKLLFVKNQLNQRFLSIAMLKELYAITPDGVFLNIFIYEKDNQVVLKGIASQMSLVFNYVSILEKSEFLKNAQVRFATKRSIKEQEFTDFEIACTLGKK